MPFKLISTDGDQSFDLCEGAPVVVGRAMSSDIPLFDPTISRRHAELECTGDGLRVRDLGSSNGTFVNGTRVRAAAASPGDMISFGKVGFRLKEVPAPPATPPRFTEDETAGSALGAMIVRRRPVDETRGPLTAALRSADLQQTQSIAADVGASEQERNERKLAILLEVSKGLSRAPDIDALLDKIAGFVFQILDVDRVAIMLADSDGRLVPKISRDRLGTEARRAVPQSIARTVVEQKVAVLSDNAPEDQRFGGQSILMQNVRSAMCAPLVSSDGCVQGVLYVDNLTTTHRFGDDDLDFLIAFSGIAAVAIENNAFAERIRREALVRSNFERYFAPSLAARIASSPDAIELGGDKRTVVVLFSDIRGFTALAATMTPDDVASLLNEYFSAMVDCVFRHGGTLDKFIGDAVMAQWGAPLGAPDDADRAMGAALDMLRELELLNTKWRADGRPGLQVGIGLNVGEVFAGNIGSERRLEFTVIGDAVNIANRLCSIAGPGEILITHEMRAALTELPQLVECAPHELKGKSQAMPVYRVVV